MTSFLPVHLSQAERREHERAKRVAPSVIGRKVNERARTQAGLMPGGGVSLLT